MSLDGFQEWTPEERAEKDAAISAVPRPLAAVLKTAVEGTHQIVDVEASELANTSFEFAAMNQILAWLNFPYKLRPYLDCLIGIAGSCETAEFTAVNIEIGRQVRTGKSIKDESIGTWVTRQKKKFQAWQSFKQFSLIDITDGKFDARTRKNTPAAYKIHIVLWAKLVVQKAQTKFYWRKEKQYRRFQIRAIRQSAYEILQSMPECGPLRLKLRTLSEEEKFDRRVHQQISAHLKNLDFLSKIDIASEDLHLYVIRELTKAYEKKRGLTGNLITPINEEPDVRSSVISKIKNGTLLEDDEQTEETPDEEVQQPRYWANGGWGESSNQMPVKDALEEIDKNAFESDNLHIEENSVCKLLETQAHEPTFLNKPENVGSTNRIAEISKIVTEWTRIVAEKMPDAPPTKLNSGVWQFYKYEVFTERAKQAQLVLQQAIWQVADDTASLAELKESAIDYLMARVEWWQYGVRTQASETQLSSIRTRLEEILNIPEDLDNG